MPPTGIYERSYTPAISAAAKARGQTGFLHPVINYQVRANGVLVHAGTNKREAERAARRIDSKKATITIL